MKPSYWWFIVLAVLCCQAPLLSANTELLASISNRLVTGVELQRGFQQEKSLPFLTRPLLSSGELSISLEEGLLWRVTKPLVSEMTVTAAGVTLDGREIQDAGTGDLIAGLMQAFMTGDLTELKRTFSISGEVLQDGWQLTLTPRSVFLKSALKRIELSGDSFLEHVVIIESNGTESKITLFEIPCNNDDSSQQGTSADASPR